MTLQQVLTEALDDEYKACAMYRKVIDKFGPVRPFVNILEAEERHIAALLPLFKRYDFPIPEDNWDAEVQASDTLLDACRAGVDAEIENVAMYDRLLAATEEGDVVLVLTNLQSASRDRHLPAFQHCLEREGDDGRGQRGRGKSMRAGRCQHGR